MKRFLIAFAIGALAIASAETYRVTLFQSSVLQGKELKPGDYKLNVTENKVTLVTGKETVETNAKVETADQKFPSTTVRYASVDGKTAIQEIRIGGTKTKLVFNE